MLYVFMFNMFKLSTYCRLTTLLGTADIMMKKKKSLTSWGLSCNVRRQALNK